MRKRAIEVCLNGCDRELLVDPGETLAELLRGDLGLTGTKVGCGIGVCGACTVIVDGRAMNSCLVPAVRVDGSSVTTIEGLRRSGVYDELQTSFVRHNALQCGFCTPGIVMAVRALLDEDPHPDEHEVREALRGNLCRCTGYEQVIEAVMDVVGAPAKTEA